MKKILQNIKSRVDVVIKNETEKHELVKVGILRKGSGSINLDNGLWSASWGICDEIEKTFPDTNEFTVTITVIPIRKD